MANKAIAMDVKPMFGLSPDLYMQFMEPLGATEGSVAAALNHKGTTVQRFNIRADQWNQCLNGVKWDRPTTLFALQPDLA